MLAFISIWLTTTLLGLAVFPITYKLFHGLLDRGYVFSKTLGLLLTSYLLWILATFGVLKNFRGSIFIIVALLAIAAWRKNGRQVRVFLQKYFTYAILVEFLFLMVLALFTLLRASNPELASGEKPMDIAFMNSIARSEHFPPQDPWFAHFPISYYYFGHLMMATLASLSGLKMAVAFNLEVGLIFALAFTSVFGLVFNLIALYQKPNRLSLKWPLFFSFLAAAVMIFAGNFEVFLEILSAHGAGGSQFWKFIDIPGLTASTASVSWLPAQAGWWWRASRIMPDAITEFPYFSALFGDLHAHVLALPLAALAIGLALNQLHTWHLSKISLSRLLLVGLCLGSLGFANTWDLPVYLALWIVALVFGQFFPKKRIDFSFLKRVIPQIIIVAGGAFVLYAPYYLSGSRSNIELTFILDSPRIKLHHFLLQFGLFLPITIIWLLWENLIRVKENVRRVFFFLIFLLIVVIPLLILHLWLFALLAFLSASAFFPLLWLVKHASEENPPEGTAIFTFILVFFIAALAFLSETVYAAGYRNNTIFKFYYAIWLLSSITVGFGTYRLWVSAFRTRIILGGLALVLFASGLTYPVLATRQKLAEPRLTTIPTLDGLAFLAEGSPLEYEAIEWLRTSVQGLPVILEIPGQSWSAGSRVSAYTGLPTLVGWIQSEEVLRGKFSNGKVDFPQLYQRLADIDLIYGAAQEKTTMTLLNKYHVRYVYVGALERQKYGNNPDKFRFLKPVFKNSQVTIYENTGF